MNDIPQIILDLVSSVEGARIEWDWGMPCVDVGRIETKRIAPSSDGEYLFPMISDGFDQNLRRQFLFTSDYSMSLQEARDFLMRKA